MVISFTDVSCSMATSALVFFNGIMLILGVSVANTLVANTNATITVKNCFVFMILFLIVKLFSILGQLIFEDVTEI
jgi:hypothetical protein